VKLLQIIGPDRGNVSSVLCFRNWFFPLRQRYVYTTAFCQSQEVRFSVILCSKKRISIINYCYKRIGILMYYTKYCLRVGVMLIPHPLLVPWSRKGRAVPLLPLWAVRPVQSLSACTRVHFTFTASELRRHVRQNSCLTDGGTVHHIWIPKTPMDLHSSETTGIQSTLNVIKFTNGMDIAHCLLL
jgi:hypothetical protein